MKMKITERQFELMQGLAQQPIETTSSQTIAKPIVRRCLSNEEVFVLSEYDPADGQTIVIGVVDSWENADKLMSDYYNDFKVVKYQDIRDSGIEWKKNIELSDIAGNTYYYNCTLQSFRVNNA